MAPIRRSEMAMFNKRTLESLCSSFPSLKVMITDTFKTTIVGQARDTKPIIIQRAMVWLSSPAVTYTAYQQKNSVLASTEELVAASASFGTMLTKLLCFGYRVPGNARSLQLLDRTAFFLLFACLRLRSVGSKVKLPTFS